ncbi:helix-turn-helix domain-containing protein [Olivibacter sp. SDN3]|uniref:helix-turn-helix domain-containing protein n=1 Tax=Olivibacter sp. SDN3 TaxID=2764720 RepID=UPI001651AF10|nr:helix-turn-helix domain-containing protein [Olivibacter sp. SDN3]QNL50943.1 helix-turn-helix domain-containing protein [Olivibacter sp. SDN3]
MVNDFIHQVTAVVEKNLSNEQFGVAEVADALNMSRSNLLRKVKKQTNLSVSQLIRQIRLQRAMEMLRESSLNVSEVAYQTGFGSSSYFIKCFREYYGYPPGVVHHGNEDLETENVSNVITPTSSKRRFIILAFAALTVALIIGLLRYRTRSPEVNTLEKSIAVLPFKNDSNDSSNVYLINGLMDATLNNLQKIKDLRVISRTSAEKYRNLSKSVPEMARELNVNYFVEGSGQKMGNRILLNVQLIEAPNDKHLWSRQYRREATDIFQLQQEVAKDIAKEIQAIITRDEQMRIEKKPTENLAAYDSFMKGSDLMRKGGRSNLEKAVDYFKKAIDDDPEFALAYAVSAIAYYYLDLFQEKKIYTSEIGYSADKALLYDSLLPESLIAKALFYAHRKEYQSAVPYLEKALEYNPNSILAVSFLSYFYNSHIPNTVKYLEYALQGVRLNAGSQDSTTLSHNYLHLSNALVQTGFVDESLQYIDQSIAYDTENSYASWVKAVVLFAKNDDAEQTKQLLRKELDKDSTQLHILQEIGKIYYYTGDCKTAYRYFKQFIELRKAHQLDIFGNVDLDIGIVLSKVGVKEESKKFIASFKHFADNDSSIYKHMHQAIYYAYLGDRVQTVSHLQRFAKEENYQYWILLFEKDPLVDPFKNDPAFKKVMQEIKDKFWKQHQEIRSSLEEKGLL